MKKTISISRSGSKRRLVRLLLAALIIYLGYYQFFYRSPAVNGNIFSFQKTLDAHTADIWSVKFSPDGKWIASGSVDSTAKIWNKETGKVLFNLKQPIGITSVDFSPAGNFLATGSYDTKIRLWNLPAGLMVKEFTGHTGTVWSVNFSPDGKSLASCGEDSTIKLWNVETGALIRTFSGHARNVWDVKFSRDGNNLASGSFDKTIKIWNIRNGKLLKTLNDHTEAIVALAYSKDGQKLASTSDDKTIKLWNTNNWSLIYSLRTPEHNQAADFSPHDKLLLTGGRDKPALGEFLQNIFGDANYNKGVSMRLWDVATGRLLQTFSKHGNDVNDVSFSPDGKWIASGSSDKSIGLWELSKK